MLRKQDVAEHNGRGQPLAMQVQHVYLRFYMF